MIKECKRLIAKTDLNMEHLKKRMKRSINGKYEKRISINDKVC